MDVSVHRKRGQLWLRSPGRPSVLGGGILERARSTTLALLGVTAAVGLAIVALALNQSWPLIAGSPIPGVAPRHEAVGKAKVAAHPVRRPVRGRRRDCGQSATSRAPRRPAARRESARFAFVSCPLDRVRGLAFRSGRAGERRSQEHARPRTPGRSQVTPTGARGSRAGPATAGAHPHPGCLCHHRSHSPRRNDLRSSAARIRIQPSAVEPWRRSRLRPWRRRRGQWMGRSRVRRLARPLAGSRGPRRHLDSAQWPRRCTPST